MDVIRAELLAIRKPILGLTVDNVEETIVADDPNIISKTTKSVFLLKFL